MVTQGLWSLSLVHVSFDVAELRESLCAGSVAGDNCRADKYALACSLCSFASRKQAWVVNLGKAAIRGSGQNRKTPGVLAPLRSLMAENLESTNSNAETH
jgi:hypothetical protein